MNVEILELSEPYANRDMTIKIDIMQVTTINKTNNLITIKYKNLGEYRESFAYIDFITGSIKLFRLYIYNNFKTVTYKGKKIKIEE